MKKKFLTFLLSLLIIFGLGFSSDVLARGVSGWAWSENIGWISFNSRNCDANADGLSDGTPAGCPATGTAMAAYGVRIEADGRMIGHAWSSNIGWITFTEAELSGCPSVPCRAWIGADNNVNGWARALAHGDGWDGWIRLRGVTTETPPRSYGVWLDTTVTPNQFMGWAWSNMVVGWISFNSRNTGAIPAYRVEIINLPPEVRPPFSPEGLIGVDADRCRLRQRYIFSWGFHDPGDTQSAFEIEIRRANVLVYSRRVTSSASSYSPDHLFGWNTEYHWQVRVWDSENAGSPWSRIISFTTPVHEPPRVNFTWTPARPAGGEEVRFRDETEFHDGGVGTRRWEWDFGGGRTSNLQHPTTTFPTTGRHTVRLTATDGSGFSCPAARTIAVGHPIWIEIPPIIWMKNFWASVTDVTNGLRDRVIVFLNNF